MAREFFGAGMLFSLVGAGVLGGAMAWSNQTEVVGTSSTGAIAFDFGPNGDLLVPGSTPVGPPGRTSRVLDGQIQNIGDFVIVLDPSSSVAVTGVTNVDVDPGAPPCLPSYFTPRFYDDSIAQGGVIPGGIGGRFHVDISLDPAAPASCSDQDVSYRLSVVTRTSGSPPAGSGAIVTKGEATVITAPALSSPEPSPTSAPSPGNTGSATATAGTATATASATGTATATAPATTSATATATTATSTATASATSGASATAPAIPGVGGTP